MVWGLCVQRPSILMTRSSAGEQKVGGSHPETQRYIQRGDGETVGSLFHVLLCTDPLISPHEFPLTLLPTDLLTPLLHAPPHSPPPHEPPHSPFPMNLLPPHLPISLPSLTAASLACRSPEGLPSVALCSPHRDGY